MENYATKNTDVFLSARRFPEYEEIGICRREPFQRDRDRIMHSRSFRRMMHKTQIFNANMGDHYRNRLTHTLEVAQISRSIGKVLGLNDELIEAIALGHDLGHTPFGHIGERTLDGILHNGLNTNIPATGGRFKHNFQSLKVVDQLETRCEDYAGINLTLATREGILKHYLLARYHMQSVVYYHDMKVQMEQIIQKIFSRAQKLHEENKLPNCPPALDTLFSSHNLQVEDYIRIDDSTFWCAFQSWSESPDVELSDYCLTILNRQKLLKLNALDNTSTAYHRFKEDFCKLLKKHNYTLVTEDSLAESPFWIEKRFVFSAYKPQKENIWIQTAAGFLVDISQQSKIVQLRDDAADEAVFLSDNERVWINRRILETLPLSNMTEFQKALDELIHNYDIRNTIEIEKKYHFSDEAVFQDVLAYLKTRDDVYSFDKSPAFEQVDSYYDTPDKLVESAKSTLRIRHKDCNYEITIKCPTPVQIKDNGQNERFEFCHPISSNSLSGEEAFIVKHVPSLKDKTSELKNTLTIINKREIINILAKKSEAKFEMAFDHVTYQDDSGHKAYDYQIEIELKSDYIHRVNLKMLTDDLERKVSKLESSTESKYKRGLTKLSVQ